MNWDSCEEPKNSDRAVTDERSVVVLIRHLEQTYVHVHYSIRKSTFLALGGSIYQPHGSGGAKVADIIHGPRLSQVKEVAHFSKGYRLEDGNEPIWPD